MAPSADGDLADEFAYTILSYESMAEVISSRRECPELRGYYYHGPFEDDVDLIIGPDYSFLLCDPTLGEATNKSAYICGFRTTIEQVKKMGLSSVEDSQWTGENFWKRS